MGTVAAESEWASRRGWWDRVDEAEVAARPSEVEGAEPRRLGELLADRQLATPVQIAEALLQQHTTGKRLGTLLVELGAIDERTLARVLGEHLGVPVVDLGKQMPDAEALAKIPETLARSLTAVPLRLTDGGLEVAVVDPSEPDVVSQLETAAGMTVIPVLAPVGEIRRTIDRSYRALEGVERFVEAFQVVAESRTATAALEKAVIDHAPIVQIVNMIVTQAMRDRASDIHIEPQEGRVRIRYRIDGALHDVVSFPLNMAPAILGRVKVMAEMNIAEARWNQGAGFVAWLPRLMHTGHALEVVLLGDRRITAKRAYEMGFVNKVVPKEHLMEEAVDWARTMCHMAPRALQNFHEMVYRAWNMSIPEAQAYTSALEFNLRGMEDSLEGPKAFAEKRAPVFKNR
jgi:hypothetical protein